MVRQGVSGNRVGGSYLYLAVLAGLVVVLASALSVLGLSGCGAEAQTTSSSIAVRWTAVGDDSLSGTATSYDLRYSTSLITDANFAQATRWTGTPVPLVAGTVQSANVTGLLPATPYWFAIKTADEVPNWSGISNVIVVATLPPPDVTPPARILDLSPKP